MCLAVFIVVQALGATQLTVQSPEVNSENLLVLLTPLVLIYGVSFFHILFDQMALPLRELRLVVKTLFVILCCLPWILGRLPPKIVPVVFPPYFPPEIQVVAGWMKPDELIMSDVPAAVAWYGRHQSVWLTLDVKDDFFAINDYMKPVQALYLTPETMDSKLASDCLSRTPDTWANFAFQIVSQSKIPSSFPLVHAPPGLLPERLFLTDVDRWKLQK